MKRLRSEHSRGFITMIVMIILIVAAVIFLAYLRVAKAQK
jgi:Tfp pilus assembly protein PilX